MAPDPEEPHPARQLLSAVAPTSLECRIASKPRRLPPPNGLCNLETGPETFQLITSSEAQAAQLKNYIGKEISVKVDEVACAEDVGQMSEAVVTKWSVVTKQ